MMQRTSILINDEEFEEVEQMLKEYQEAISQELSQKKLATNSSVWDMNTELQLVGGDNLQVKQLKSEKFVANVSKK